MEYTISDKAKKVTLGVAVVGLVLLVIGFFSQKDFVYAEKVNDHAVSITYNGKADIDQQNKLKEEIKEKLGGYEIEFHESNHHSSHANHQELDASHNQTDTEHATLHASADGDHGHEVDHVHHGPTFVWDVHLNHTATAESHDNHTESGADKLVTMVNDGEIAFADRGNRRFWSNLLVNGFFFFGIALGALFYLALHYATESGWGVVLLRIFEGIMSAMPIGIAVLLIVFIAGTFGGHHIYAWMDPEYTDPNSSHFDPIIYGKRAYLNLPFFWIRVVAYFTTFYLFLRWFKNKSRQEDKEGGTESHFKMYRRGALFLVFFAVFSSTMAWDFIMSIDTHWFSTLFGWYVFASMAVSGITTIALISIYLKSNGYLPNVNDNHLHDLGKFMFGFSVFWTYLWFSQFMLIWYSNIPEEVVYFISRIEDYTIPFWGMVVINFVLPFLLLVSSSLKRVSWILVMAGIVILVGHYMDVFNMIMPSAVGDQWFIGIPEISSIMFFAGLFIYIVFSSLEKAPLEVKGDPFNEESKKFIYPF